MKAFAFYNDKDKTNRQLDQQFQQLQFQNPIRPGTTQVGFVLVNLDEGYKAVDIDLLADEAVKSFSFIFADPEFKADYKAVDSESSYTDEDIINIEAKKPCDGCSKQFPAAPPMRVGTNSAIPSIWFSSAK